MTDNGIIQNFKERVDFLASVTSVYLDEDEGLALYQAAHSALELINRKCSEVEALTARTAKQEATIDRLENEKALFQGEVADAQAEIEKLKEEKHILSQKRANIFEITSAFDRGRTDGIKKIADKTHRMVTDIYNKHIFGGDNDLTDEEKDAIINYSDDIVSGFEDIVKEMVGDLIE